jgi:hypothetical protein
MRRSASIKNFTNARIFLLTGSILEIPLVRLLGGNRDDGFADNVIDTSDDL